MSFNGSGTFNINTAGQPVVTGTVISSTAFNALTADLATGLSTAITTDGQSTTTARIPFAAGVSSTLTTDSTSVGSGSIITAGGVGIAKALWVGGLANIAGALSTIAQTITSASANALTVGRQGTTDPAFNVDASTALSVTGVRVKSAAAGGGAAVSVLSSGTNEALTVDAKGSGAIGIGSVSTGAVTITPATTLSNALTYGGVTLSNSVTGTGSMVLATAPALSSPVLTTPALGTPASGVLTSCTGLPLTTGITGTLAASNGGTGLTSPGASGNVLVSNGSAWTSAAITKPTVTVYTSGSGTFSTPAGATSIWVRISGGGGGGGASGTAGVGAAGAGGSTTFGTSLLSATGGGLGGVTANDGGAGGTGSGGDINISGGKGQFGGTAAGMANIYGGWGGASSFAAAGGPGFQNSPGFAGAGYGAAGGGAGPITGSNGAAGGGGGGYTEKLISSPNGSYSYAVGAAGTAGTAGTGGQAGGAGVAGVVIIQVNYE